MEALVAKRAPTEPLQELLRSGNHFQSQNSLREIVIFSASFAPS